MKRYLVPVALGAVLGAGGLSLASHGGPGGETVKVLSERDVNVSIDGKEARATTVEVTFGPGVEGKPHRHPGPVFGYVLEGKFELGLDDRPSEIIKAGETFYEPAGAVHRVGRNAAAKGSTRLLVVSLHSRDAKGILLPAGTGGDE